MSTRPRHGDFIIDQDNSVTAVGWTTGAGVEWMVGPRWSLKAEYLYADLGKHGSAITYTFPFFGGGTDTSTLTSKVHDSYNIVRAGVNYHF